MTVAVGAERVQRRRPRAAPGRRAPHPAPAAQTPVLVTDLAVVARSYRELAAALPGVALHYAVKANPSPPVLRVLAGLGCRWDVASPGEVDAVLAVDADPGHQSYGNTVKKAADIAYAFDRGVRRFALDSEAELGKLVRHAPGATLLVRITTTGRGADWALGEKFGCAEDEAAGLLARAVRHGHPVGVCFHVGSQQRRLDAWEGPLAATARLRARLNRCGADLSVVDLGGGFPAATVEPVPSAASFGRAVGAAVTRHLGPDVPALMAEPGRALVAEAGVLETEVVLVAERDGVRWVYVDAGLFSGLAETLGETLRYRITAHRDGLPLGGATAPAVLAGPTCDSVDVLYREHRPALPVGLRPGDRLHLHATGAYTTTYSSVGFNGFAPLREVHR